MSHITNKQGSEKQLILQTQWKYWKKSLGIRILLTVCGFTDLRSNCNLIFISWAFKKTCTKKIIHYKNWKNILPSEWMPGTFIKLYRISWPIRRTVTFSLEILEKNYECILILLIYWKKTGLLHTKISNHNIIYSS